jgi:serine/threonine-protein kinase
MPVPLPPPAAAAPLPPPAPPPPAAEPAPAEAAPAAEPPPADAAPGEKKKPSVDMDWDDEEESTHVYDKQKHDFLPGLGRPPSAPPPPPGPPMSGGPGRAGAAAALLANSGGTAAPGKSMPPMGLAPLPPPPPVPMMSPPSGPPGAMGMQGMQGMQGMPPPSMSPGMQGGPVSAGLPPRMPEDAITQQRQAVAQPSGGGKVGLILGGVALVVALGVAAFFLLPRTGQLKIDVRAKNGGQVDRAEIFVDGQKRCDTAPCVVADLPTGPKIIKVIAAGQAPASVTEVVESGREKVVMIPLEGSTATAAAATTAEATSAVLKAASDTPGVKVFVDGEDKGTLPIELKNLSPGSHKLRFEAGPDYDKLEQTVDLASGDTKDLGSIKLKVLKGHLTLELATPGANVLLVSQNDKKVEKKIPEALWKSPPVKLDIDPEEKWKLVATKKGYEDWSQELSFVDGKADKTVRIELTEEGKGAKAEPDKTAVAAPTPAPAAPTGASPPATATPAPAPTPDKPAATGNGTLNLNSIPVSKVVLDGKPLGSTPKVGVSVPAGTHTVTFIHPDLGKKSVSVTVKSGETKTAAVKFDK